MELKNKNICCCFGHRKIHKTSELITLLKCKIEELIVCENIDTFLFGSKSDFNDLCYDIVTELKKKYTYIKRIYVRAEFQYINKKYTEYLLSKYEDTFFPEAVINAGKTAYIKRNCEMINLSRICIVYYDYNYLPEKTKSSKNFINENRRNSGTKYAYDYAQKKGKLIINMNKYN